MANEFFKGLTVLGSGENIYELLSQMKEQQPPKFKMKWQVSPSALWKPPSLCPWPLAAWPSP